MPWGECSDADGVCADVLHPDNRGKLSRTLPATVLCSRYAGLPPPPLNAAAVVQATFRWERSRLRRRYVRCNYATTRLLLCPSAAPFFAKMREGGTLSTASSRCSIPHSVMSVRCRLLTLEVTTTCRWHLGYALVNGTQRYLPTEHGTRRWDATHTPVNVHIARICSRGYGCSNIRCVRKYCWSTRNTILRGF